MQVGIIVVEICHRSLIQTVDVEEILESEYPEVAVLKNECLSFCGLCKHKPFAIVNGTRVFADTPEACLEKIRERIELELAAFI